MINNKMKEKIDWIENMNYHKMIRKVNIRLKMNLGVEAGEIITVVFVRISGKLMKSILS